MKTLSALSFLSMALLATHGIAETQIYGTLRHGVSVVQTQKHGQHHSQTSINDFGSYVGIRGSLPLRENQTRLIWQLNQDFSIGKPSNQKATDWQWKDDKSCRLKNCI